MSKFKTKVAVALSGGVDSAVSAYLLKKSGYDVHAFFMNNWTDHEYLCESNQDKEDAISIADQLDIPISIISLESQYRADVFQKMLADYKAGLIPNPDILCNRYIKFNAFIQYAMNLDMTLIATGHYAQINQKQQLIQGCDPKKDQTYFLCGISHDVIQKTLFPIGHLHKHQVRQIAQENNLIVSRKKDSVGVCFVGPKSFKTFLQSHIICGQGNIELEDGTIVGQHEGAIFYTLGQRQGLNIGGIKNYPESPWYIIKRCITSNTITIDQNPKHPILKTKQFELKNINSLTNEKIPEQVYCRLRHGGPLYTASLHVQDSIPKIKLNNEVYALSPGQWCALYHNDQCIGGGQIIKTYPI